MWLEFVHQDVFRLEHRLEHLACDRPAYLPKVIVIIFCCLADTKDQWARDDPAFLVLLTFWLFGKYVK